MLHSFEFWIIFHANSTISDVANRDQFKRKVLAPIRYAATAEFCIRTPDAEGKEAFKEEEKLESLPNILNIAKQIYKALTHKTKNPKNPTDTAKSDDKKVSLFRHPRKYLKQKLNSAPQSTVEEVPKPNTPVKIFTELNRLTDDMNAAYEPYEP